jgi:Uma2 family endonuclease
MASVAPTVVTPANDRIVLYNVGWQTYANLRQNLGDKPTRLTYDGNNLEIMSPSRWHELAGRFLGTMIRAMSAELDLPIASGGSTTFQRPDVERALEPDECFWVANEAQVREKHDIDLAVDPPPILRLKSTFRRAA